MRIINIDADLVTGFHRSRFDPFHALYCIRLKREKTTHERAANGWNGRCCRPVWRAMFFTPWIASEHGSGANESRGESDSYRISVIHACNEILSLRILLARHTQSPVLNELRGRHTRINIHLGIAETVFHLTTCTLTWSSPSNFYAVCLGRIYMSRRI